MMSSEINQVVCPASLETCRMVEAAIFPFEDGRLYLACSCGESANFTEGDIRIMGKWSHDEGNSWSEPFLIWKCEGKANVMEPSFLQLSSGRILHEFQQRDGYFQGDERFGNLHPMITWSDDECETWSEPTSITGDNQPYFSTNDRLVPLSSGRILLPVLTAPDMTSIRVWMTDDNGQTWRKSSGEIRADDGVTYGYPMAAELDDGTVAMFVLNSTESMHIAHSNDEGDTWALVSTTGPSPCPATFIVRGIPESPDLLLLWNNHASRTNLTSAISRDNGQTWSNFRLLEAQEGWPAERTHAFPSLAFMNGYAHMTYYENTPHPRTGSMFDLVYRRLPISWFYQQDVRRAPRKHSSVASESLPGLPNDPISFRQMRVTEAWRKYAGELSWGKGQCLAILDDGCDLSVPEWQVSLPWGEPKVVAGYNSIDENEDPSPVPPGYHGTSVGFPSSLHHGGRSGVAFNNSVIHIRGISVVHLREDESETMARGLQWIIDHHAQYNITAVNLSPVDDQEHAEPLPTAIDEKLEELRRLGIWVSAPCANNGFTKGISWPASQPYCFAIGATKADEDVPHLDRFNNTDILVPANATSSSNAQIVGSAMVLREAIERSGYDWRNESDNLPDALMALFRKTGIKVHDHETGLDFRRLDLLAAIDWVYS